MGDLRLFKDINLSQFRTKEAYDDLWDNFALIEDRGHNPERYPVNRKVTSRWIGDHVRRKKCPYGTVAVPDVHIPALIDISKEIYAKEQPLTRNVPGIMEAYIEQHIENLRDLNTKDFGALYSEFVQSLGLDFRRGSHPFYDFNERQLRYGKKITHLDIKQSLEFKKKIYMKSLPTSKIVWISLVPSDDLNRNNYCDQFDIIQIVGGLLNTVPIFISSSSKSNGKVYVAFKFKDYLADSKRAKLEDYFLKEFKFKIHIHRSNPENYKTLEEYIPFPFNRDSLFYGTYAYGGNYLRVGNYKNFSDILTQMREAEPSTSKGISKLVGSPFDGEIIRGERSVSTNPDIRLTSFIGRALDRFRYGLGTRFEQQRRLALWCRYHQLSFQDYERLAFQCHDGTSKDMNHWSPERISNALFGYYEFARKVVTTDVTDFKRELDGLDPEDKIYDNTQTRTILDTNLDLKGEFIRAAELWYEKTNPSPRSQGAWKKYFLEDTVNLMNFILRKREYDEETQKKYHNDKYAPLNEGVSIPKVIWTRLSKYLNLRVNIQRIFNFLREMKILVPIEIEGFSYSFKEIFHSIHFYINMNLKYMNRITSILLYKHIGLSSNWTLSYMAKVLETQVEKLKEKRKFPRRIPIFDG